MPLFPQWWAGFSQTNAPLSKNGFRVSAGNLLRTASSSINSQKTAGGDTDNTCIYPTKSPFFCQYDTV
jgi:hypothetical protein